MGNVWTRGYLDRFLCRIFVVYLFGNTVFLMNTRSCEIWSWISPGPPIKSCDDSHFHLLSGGCGCSSGWIHVHRTNGIGANAKFSLQSFIIGSTSQVGEFTDKTREASVVHRNEKYWDAPQAKDSQQMLEKKRQRNYPPPIWKVSVIWSEPKLAWAKQESIIHALSVPDITQKVINIFYFVPNAKFLMTFTH